MKIYDYNGRKNLSGNNIKIARQRARISQTELAVKLQNEGVTIERDSISRIESGKRLVTDYELVLIAKVLNIPILTLLNGEL